ncbi:MAG: DUF3592 domain-containing protein [Terracidiphilus sp.]|jgi:hypothetical protein
MAGLVIDIYIGFVVRWLIIVWHKVDSRQWPTATGRVVRCHFEEHGFGGDYAVLQYKYKVDSERFQGVLKRPYIYPNYADAFVRHYPAGMELRIRANPQNPAQSFPVID